MEVETTEKKVIEKKDMCLVVVERGSLSLAALRELPHSLSVFGFPCIQVTVSEKQPCALQIYKLSDLKECTPELAETALRAIASAKCEI